MAVLRVIAVVLLTGLFPPSAFAQGMRPGVPSVAPTSWARSSRPVVINGNPAALPASPAGTMFQIANVDSSGTSFTIDSFGGTPSLVFRRAQTSAASPSYVPSGTVIGSLGARGYGATAYPTSSRTSVVFYSDQDWTDGAQGTRIVFNTTPNGGTGQVERMRIDNAGAITVAALGSGPVFTNAGALTNTNPTSAPTNATDTCTAGQWVASSSYAYFCIATNTWRRVAIAAW